MPDIQAMIAPISEYDFWKLASPEDDEREEDEEEENDE
jgi:hypothetical protein